jgi:sodium transport system permease protein
VYPRLTSREQLAYYGRFYGLKGKRLNERVQAVIDLLDMQEIADRRAEGFSRGQRQKIVIGRALVHDPHNISMDEPTNGLDVMAVRETRDTIPWITSIIADKAQQPLTIPAQGIQYAGQAFLNVLKEQKITLEPFTGDLQAAIARGQKAAGLVILPGFSDSITKEQPATVTLLTNHTSGGIFGGGFSGDRLNLAVNAYSRLVATNRVQVRKLDPSILNPVTVAARDLATPVQMAGLFAAFTLPLLLGSIIAQGGLFVAIDVTAGEKELGTLESLLVTPASDFEVLTGKLAAVFTITAIPVALTFMGFWAAGQLLPTSITNGGTLPLGVIIGTILLSLPLALFIDVALMIISVRTKAFKEAQSVATPVGFAAIAPAMLAAFVTPTNTLMYLIPIYGPAALVSAMATGTELPAVAFILTVLGSLAAASMAFMIALRFFNRERMLYGL